VVLHVLDIKKISMILIVMIQLNGMLKRTLNGPETATLTILTQQQQPPQH
jgi:hypothetical protein